MSKYPFVVNYVDKDGKMGYDFLELKIKKTIVKYINKHNIKPNLSETEKLE